MESGDIKREGYFLIFAALVLVAVSIVLSDGYSPEYGFLTSLLYSMHIFEIRIGCEEATSYPIGTLQCEEGFGMMVYTKYVISALAVAVIYGVGQVLRLFPSVMWWRKS